MADVVERPTLADGLAGAVEPDSITLALVRAHVSDMVLVTEDEIRESMAWASRRGQKIEPSAAVALAAALRGSGANRLAVLSGGNVDPGLWEAVGRHAHA